MIVFGLILFGVLAVVYVYYEINAIFVRKYTVPVDNLPPAFEGFEILHISDLHSKEFGREQRRLLKKIKKHDFDMVALTGDLIDYKIADVQPAVNLVKGLSGKPAFFVTGNHERWVRTNLVEALEAEGVTHLRNRAVELERGGEAILVVGVEAPHAADKLGPGPLPLDAPEPKVLLAHSPNIFMSAVRHDIDLLLVGHTHGGQVRIPGLRTLYAPGQGLWPKYDHGVFASGKTTMVISAGLGESTWPIRVAIKPEIVLVKLIRR